MPAGNLCFVDGGIGRGQVVATLACVAGGGTQPIYMYMHDTGRMVWVQRCFDHPLVSMAYTCDADLAHAGDEPTMWHLLSRCGTLIQSSQAGVHVVDNVDADGRVMRGQLHRLRVIGDAVFACGFGRQVYRLDGGAWTRISAAIEVDDPQETRFSFRDIAGQSAHDLYAVGWLGEMFHYDGDAWRRIATGVDADLTSLRVAHDGVLHVAAKNGLYLRGREDAFEVVQAGHHRASFLDVELYGEDVYLACLDGLHRYRQGVIAPVDAGSAITAHRLAAKNGVLWSFGSDHLMRFDGTQWHAAMCPDY